MIRSFAKKVQSIATSANERFLLTVNNENVLRIKVDIRCSRGSYCGVLLILKINGRCSHQYTILYNSVVDYDDNSSGLFMSHSSCRTQPTVTEDVLHIIFCNDILVVGSHCRNFLSSNIYGK